MLYKETYLKFKNTKRFLKMIENFKQKKAQACI